MLSVTLNPALAGGKPPPTTTGYSTVVFEKTFLTVSNSTATYSCTYLLDVLFNFMVDALVNTI